MKYNSMHDGGFPLVLAKEGYFNNLFLDVTVQKLLVLNFPDFLRGIRCNPSGCTEKW